MAEIMLAKLGAVIALEHQRCLLVSKRLDGRRKGHWQFPGGHVNEGEDFITAAIREFCEETGRKDHLRDLTIVSPTIMQDKFLAAEGWMANIYHMTTLNSYIPDNPEPLKHTNWCWMFPQHLAEKEYLLPGMRAILARLL